MKNNRTETVCNRKNSPIKKWMIERKIKKLQLNESQKKAFNELMTSFKSTYNLRKNTKNEVLTSVAEMIPEKNLKREQVTELLHKAADRHIEHATNLIEAFNEFYQDLEPWQQDPIRSMWEKRMHRRSRYCH